MPELYQHLPAVGDVDQQVAKKKAHVLEKWLVERLDEAGYGTWGGTSGMDGNPFAPR